MELYKLRLDALMLLGFIAGLLFYLPFLGSTALFDWDEINFAECAREMIVLGDYLHVHIDFEAFWEKPPLFIWLQVLSMKIFGINEFAARFPNAFLGALSIPLLTFLGNRYASKKVGVLWAMMYTVSLLPFLYFKSGIIDPWFNTFIILSYMGAYEYAFRQKSYRFLLISGLFCGLAILTKGPAALLLLGLSALVLSLLQKKLIISFKDFMIWIILAICIPGLWFLIDYISNGPFFIRSFLDYQFRLLTTEDAGHGGFPAYHFVIVLLACFPAALLSLPLFFQKRKNNDLVSWMKVIALVTLIVFSLVQSKIIHYSSLTYIPLSFLAASYLSKKDLYKLPKWLTIAFFLISTLWILSVTSLPIAVPYLLAFIPESANAYAVLSMDIEWPIYYSFLSLFFCIPILLYSIRLRKSKLILFSSFSYMFFMFLFTCLWVPKVADYTQTAMVEFYQEHKHLDVYIENYGFKSYADLFYTDKMPDDKIPKSLERSIKEGLDKDLLIVTKIHREDKLRSMSTDLELMSRKGEFAFYKRAAMISPTE